MRKMAGNVVAQLAGASENGGGSLIHIGKREGVVVVTWKPARSRVVLERGRGVRRE
jgi:hypothetical protein